jgi:transcriptional regulator with XRE-family HTH domain
MGFLIPRTTIANIESGRRESVSVQEIAVLAAALDIPPTLLVFDPASDDVELLPGRSESGIMASEWWSGNKAANLHSKVPLERQSGQLPPTLAARRQAQRLEVALIRSLEEIKKLHALKTGGDADPALDLEWENAVAAARNTIHHLRATGHLSGVARAMIEQLDRLGVEDEEEPA